MVVGQQTDVDAQLPVRRHGVGRGYLDRARLDAAFAAVRQGSLEVAERQVRVGEHPDEFFAEQRVDGARPEIGEILFIREQVARDQYVSCHSLPKAFLMIRFA